MKLYTLYSLVLIGLGMVLYTINPFDSDQQGPSDVSEFIATLSYVCGDDDFAVENIHYGKAGFGNTIDIYTLEKIFEDGDCQSPNIIGVRTEKNTKGFDQYPVGDYYEKMLGRKEFK